MKKNLLFGLIALTGLFASCSQDEVLNQPTDNSNQVSMSIEMPADFAKTRAVPSAPAEHKLRCILEVWTKDGATMKVRKEQVATGTETITFAFELAEQGDYKAVLWADYIEENASETSGHYPDKYYITNDATGLKKVTINTNGGYPYTAQLREAFTGSTEFTKDATAKTGLTATLTRPLTKVTIAEKTTANFDLCTNVKAAYTVPSEFNAFAATVGAATYSATYDAAPEGTDITVAPNTYKSLFTDYVFTTADATMGEIAMTFTGTSTLNPKTIPAGIPLKRNNWVRAAGNLIAAEYNANASISVDMTDTWTEVNTDAPESVTVNGIKVAIGNLVADGSNSAKIGAPTDNGLFFQFGSLIGWSTEGEPAIVVKPAAFTGDGAWGATGKIWQGTEGTVTFTVNGSGSNDEKAGIGDPCRYYLGDPWRLPTKEEYAALFNNVEEGINNYTNSGWSWESGSAIHTSSKLTLPTPGNRTAQYGQLGNNIAGKMGYYWSASPIDASNGHNLIFVSNRVYLASGNARGMGLPVRCVQANN